MEKITRKSFTEAICGNNTAFFGAPRHEAAWVCDRLENAIKNTDFYMVERRTATPKSNAIQFCNGSMLYFNQKCEKTCYHAEVMGKHVYMFEEKYIDRINETENFITCVYCVV